MKYWFLLLAVLLSISLSFAQQITQPLPVKSYSHQYTTLNSEEYTFIDTTYKSLGDYYKWSFSDNEMFGKLSLGNLGQAQNSLIYQSDRSVWDIYDFRGLNTDVLEMKGIKQFYVRSPLTEAHYRMGYERGQAFDIYHTQNINAYWNAGIHYYRLNSDGNYINEEALGSKFVANSKYYNPSNGTEVTTFFIQEKREIGQNGGIEDRTDFEENLFGEQILIPINLELDTRTIKRRVFYNDFAFNLFRLGVEDSLVDTDSTKILTNVESPFFKLGYTLNYEDNTETYFSSGSNEFYDNSFFTDDDYTDSNAFRKVENTLYLKGKVGKVSNLRLLAGVKHQYSEYSGEDFVLAGNSLGLVSKLNGTIKNILDVSGSFDYILTGPLAQSISLKTTAELKIFKRLKGFGGYAVKSLYPTITSQFFRSNHYIWQNNFNKSTENELSYGIRWSKNGSISAKSIVLSNYVYFNSEANPVQDDELIVVNQFLLNQNFTFFDFIHFDNRLIYQPVRDVNKVLPLPDFITRNALYFEFSLFNNELKCLLGGELNYFSAYNSPSYNPATATFYVENKYSIGNYPLVNVFANFQLKSARVYLKYQHVNEGFSGSNYYAAPDYALPERVFLVGIDWRFFN